MIKVLRISVWFSTLFFINIYGYQWPLYPSDVQHYVYSTLDECRSKADTARHHFHDGIDILAIQSTNVYAVESGFAYHCGTEDNEGIRVQGTPTWYVHLGTRVAHGTYLYEGDWVGQTNALNHLHFGEGPNQNEVNPLRSDGIDPFVDNRDPEIDTIYLLENGTNTVMDPDNVTGPVDIVMQAHDTITDGGWNCGIYKVGYEIDNTGEINKYQFDNWLSSSCINYVYTEGSNNTTFKYIVTNNTCSDDCWDPPGIGWYRIWVYAYDIKNNWDLDYIDVYVSQTGVEEYYIQVNSPNGGEVWYYDETHNITWNTGTLAETPADSVVIHYSKMEALATPTG